MSGVHNETAGASDGVCTACMGKLVEGKVEMEVFDALSDEEIENIIHRVHEQYDYIVDPHTACGFKAIDPEKTTVTLATAHPAKFPETMGKAIGIEPTIDSLEVLKEKNSIFYPIAAEKKAIQGFIEENAVS